MPAATLNLKMEQGADFYQHLTFSQGTTPIDLTGWTFRGEMRSAVDSATVIATFKWEYSIGFNRHAPFVSGVGAVLGLTEDQIDQLWIQAAQI